MKCESFIAKVFLRRCFLFTLLLPVFFILSTSRVYSQFSYPYYPLFQYAIFYNLNLEIDPGATFPITAPVFCNDGIWSGNGNTTYSSTVWAVGSVNTTGTDSFAYHKTDVGTPAGNFYLSGQPVSGVAPISFPVFGITNLHAMLDLPPPTYALGTANAYTTNGLTYLANEAGLIISNSISGTNWGSLIPRGTNFIVYYQDSTYLPSPLLRVTNDFYILSNTVTHSLFYTNHIPFGIPNPGTNIWYAGYSFLTNVLFYDWREGWNGGSGIGGKGKPVQAVQFDVGKYNNWLTNHMANGGYYYNNLSLNNWHHSIGAVYIYNSVTNTTTTLPAVRVVNGAQLFDSYGLTIATPFPLYVLGDYNVSDGSGSNAGQNLTTHTHPAGLFGDSISVLSSNWNDGVTNKLPTPSTTTTVNAACLEGIVPSDPTITASDSSSYSGGVENSFRLLENWSSKTLYYNGSIAVLFPSQYATNRWRDTGNYYNAPIRHWAFDTNFTVLSKLPPLTPDVINSNLVPSISVQPTNQIVLSGQSTDFAIIAAGVPFVNCQWIFNGTNIPNATNTSLALANLQLTNAGNYTVQVTNVLGSITSSNAVLSVYLSAAATMDVASYSADNGFQFQISGVPGFSYVVQSSTNLIDWTPLITNVSPFNFTDTNAAEFPQEFYRSVYFP